MAFEIHGFGSLRLNRLAFDHNGTLAVDEGLKLVYSISEAELGVPGWG